MFKDQIVVKNKCDLCDREDLPIHLDVTNSHEVEATTNILFRDKPREMAIQRFCCICLHKDSGRCDIHKIEWDTFGLGFGKKLSKYLWSVFLIALGLIVPFLRNNLSDSVNLIIFASLIVIGFLLIPSTRSSWMRVNKDASLNYTPLLNTLAQAIKKYPEIKKAIALATLTPPLIPESRTKPSHKKTSSQPKKMVKKK